MGAYDDNWLLYDGACPFCRSYVGLARLRTLSPGFGLLDARHHPELCAAMYRRGFDADLGMVLSWRGSLHHGADALWMLARIDRRAGALAAIGRLAFRSPTLTRLSYPLFQGLRALALGINGRGRIAPPAEGSKPRSTA